MTNYLVISRLKNFAPFVVPTEKGHAMAVWTSGLLFSTDYNAAAANFRFPPNPPEMSFPPRRRMNVRFGLKMVIGDTHINPIGESFFDKSSVNNHEFRIPVWFCSAVLRQV
ncbi:hypothetical protein [Marivivens marinus]|uniref:hypothetical protein n=1 Tax=Marivivens marinus TaxID=3110173 RepID=UPI003B845E31